MPLSMIAIVGPTAVGKTTVSIELAQQFNAEIVCVDSVLPYRYFNIGTAKPTEEEKKGIQHHLIDIRDPKDTFTAGDFCRSANRAIEDIQSRGKNVFLVGGSGFYLKALEKPMWDVPSSDPKIREELEKEEGLYEKLIKVDPEIQKMLHPNDCYRILRATEIYRLTGKTVSQFQKENSKKRLNILKIGLKLDSEKLRQNIKIRTERMLERGLIDEVKRLKSQYSLSIKPFQSIGYKETLLYLEGKLTPQDLTQRINSETYQLARRQMTWFRADQEIQWSLPLEVKKILDFAKF